MNTRRRALSILVLVIAVVSKSAFANPEQFRDIFEHSFYNAYAERYCQVNIFNFLNKLQKAGHDISEMRVLIIENVGTSNSGLVQAKNARNASKSNGVINWNVHVISIDRLGYVYDFSFGEVPEILPFEDYVRRMYLSPNVADPSITYRVPPERVLKEYYTKWYAPEEYLRKVAPRALVKLTLEATIQRIDKAVKQRTLGTESLDSNECKVLRDSH